MTRYNQMKMETERHRRRKRKLRQISNSSSSTNATDTRTDSSSGGGGVLKEAWKLWESFKAVLGLGAASGEQGYAGHVNKRRRFNQ